MADKIEGGLCSDCVALAERDKRIGELEALTMSNRGCIGYTIGLEGQIKRLTVELAGYEECLADKRRLTRELDVIINGDDAAEQASLCDIVAQMKRIFPEKSMIGMIVELQERVQDITAELARARNALEKIAHPKEHPLHKSYADWMIEIAQAALREAKDDHMPKV